MIKSKTLEHLSNEEIEELYRRYVEGEKNDALIKEYKISCNTNMLYSLFPPLILDDLCPYCSISMMKTRPSKTAKNGGAPTCIECKHTVPHPSRYYRKSCRCLGCTTKRDIEEQRIRDETRLNILASHNTDQHTPLAYKSVSFTHKVYLLALLRTQTGELFDSINALDSLRLEPFSPTTDKDLSILEELSEKRLLLPNPNSAEHAFNSENGYKSYDHSSVTWIPNIYGDDHNRRLNLEELWNLLNNELSDQIQLNWKEQVEELLFDIAVEEVVQHLAVKLEEVRMEPTAHIKTRLIIRELLENFAVREIFYFCKLASEKTAIFFYSGKSKGKKHATNSITKKLSDYGKTSLSQNWERYKYHRTPRYPRSSLSYILNELVLKDADKGFEKPLRYYWNDELMPRFFNGASFNKTHSRLACKECGSTCITTSMRDNSIYITCKDCDAFVTYNENA